MAVEARLFVSSWMTFGSLIGKRRRAVDVSQALPDIHSDGRLTRINLPFKVSSLEIA